MASMIRDFALQLLRRLQSRPRGSRQKEVQNNGDVSEEHDENMEDGQLPQEDILQTPYLPEQLELPAQSDQIIQHLELLFALSTRSPEFLDEYVFGYYPQWIFECNTIADCLQRTVGWKKQFKKRYNSSLPRSFVLLDHLTGSY
jgi:hypothetical protein